MPHDVSDAGFWEERYAQGEAGWDLGGPCPVLRDLLDTVHAPPEAARIAVPGCGFGHDVRLLREHGYDAVGFDFAVESQDPPIEQLDAFELGRRRPASFDAIFEYTCYCAIDPARRVEYVASLRAALAPGGCLIALLYPIRPRDGEGPPFAVEEREIDEVFAKAPLTLVHVETPSGSVERRLGRERLAIFRKDGHA